MSGRVVFTIIFFAGGLHSSFAQQAFTSLEEVWGYADSHNIQIVSAKANKEMADKGLQQAYGNMFPVINSSGNYIDNIKIQPTLVPDEIFGGQPGTFKEVKFGQRYLYNGILNLQLNVINTQDWFNIRAAKYNSEIASLNISKTRRDTYEQIANSYYSCLLLREIFSLSEENFLSSDSTFRVARNKSDEGVINEIVLNSAAINLEKARKSVEEAGENESIAMNNLKILLNMKPGDSIILKEDFGNGGSPFTANISFTPDPEVGLSNLQMEQARNNLQLAKALLAPTLSAVYQYTAQFSTNTAFDFVSATSLPQQYWGIRINFPLFTGGTRVNQIRKMKIDLDNKQKIHESTVNQSDLANRNVLLEYKKTRASFTRAMEILALYKANDEHAGRRFSEGLISLEDRLKAYSDYVMDENDYIQSFSDYLIQYYRIQIRQKAL
jgi:outer membrane protein TolC